MPATLAPPMRGRKSYDPHDRATRGCHRAAPRCLLATPARAY
jgi:hypothetical protein